MACPLVTAINLEVISAPCICPSVQTECSSCRWGCVFFLLLRLLNSSPPPPPLSIVGPNSDLITVTYLVLFLYGHQSIAIVTIEAEREREGVKFRML